MKISYAITVCNEVKEIKKLISILLESKREDDEVVVLFDKQNGTAEVWSYLQDQDVVCEAKSFKNHFADWKNYLTGMCSGDYIFQIDADEIPNTYLIENLPEILESNPDNDVYLVPRVNTVEGLTQEHIDKWKWNVNEKGWVNFPDYQTRIYKNTDDVKWMNKVHERITGYDTFSNFPAEEQWSLYHPKQIDRQEQQNQFYETI